MRHRTTVLDRVVTVRFDANVSPHLAWKFEPVLHTMDVKIGENALAFYRATNMSDKPLKGTAAFNVAPEAAGIYFNKIAVLLLHRADAAARTVRRDAGELLHRSQDR